MPVDGQRNQTLYRRLSRLLRKVADNPEPETVHQFRTTIRRIEALLAALSPEPERNQRKLLKVLARVRRRAGKVRDMDVQMARLRTLKIGRDGDRKERLLQSLTDLRAAREEKMISALDKATLREIRKRLKRSAEELHLFPQMQLGNAGENMRRRSDFEPVGAALRMFAQVARAQGPLRQENLHAYRLQTKQVRYVAEMAGEDEIAKRIVTELKRMQDAIGEWHDWLELTQRAEDSFAGAAESPLISALRNVTGAKYREALAICTDVRKAILDVGKTAPPPRKSVASVPRREVAVSA